MKKGIQRKEKAFEISSHLITRHHNEGQRVSTRTKIFRRNEKKIRHEKTIIRHHNGGEHERQPEKENL
jgi:hypothetical protein